MGRAYIYVDGENHYLRSVAALAKLLGRPDAANLLPKCKLFLGVPRAFPASMDGERFGIEESCSFFWDCEIIHYRGGLGDETAVIERAIYVTACSGDEDKVHAARSLLRRHKFEPVVIPEMKAQAARRARKLADDAIIEKPKGCDIALATRMVSDAAAGLFDACALFTSDADFLPAIEAVRRLGKVVWVYGFSDAIGGRSPFQYVPDRFVDLAVLWGHMAGNHRGKIREVFGPPVVS